MRRVLERDPRAPSLAGFGIEFVGIDDRDLDRQPVLEARRSRGPLDDVVDHRRQHQRDRGAGKLDAAEVRKAQTAISRRGDEHDRAE